MNARKIVVAMWFVSMLLCGNSVGQEHAEELMRVPPLPPFIGQFEFWSQQFVQWPAATFPIRSIEVSVISDSRGKNPAYDIVLENRKSHKRIHYLSDGSLVAKIHDGEAYVVPITVKKTEDEPLTYEFDFTDHEGNSVFWRFVQGSDVSDRGSGLTQIARQDTHPQFMLMYREQGAAAGQGTALQIGKDVSEAEVWKEISAPPYFVAYRGALTVGADLGIMIPGEVEWHVDQQPKSLAAGQSWKLSSSENWKGAPEKHSGTVEISKVSAEGYTFLFKTESFGSCEIIADAVAGQWRIKQVAYGDANHGFTVAFQPGVVASASANKENPTFDIRMGKNKRVAEGTIVVTPGSDGQVEMEWQFKNPNWAKARKVAEKIATAPGKFYIHEIVEKRDTNTAGSVADKETLSAGVSTKQQ